MFSTGAPSAGWTSPILAIDSGPTIHWAGAQDAIDDESWTSALCIHNNGEPNWGQYLYLHFPFPFVSDSLRFIAVSSGIVDSIEFETFDGFSWSLAWSGPFASQVWVKQAMTSRTVEQMRVRLRTNSTGSGFNFELFEVDCYKPDATGPQLAWTGEPNLTGDGLDPDSGHYNTNIKFRTRYSDIDNEGPMIVQIWIDKNGDGDYLDANEKLDMNVAQDVIASLSDGNFDNGEVYTLTTTVPYTPGATLSSRFYANGGVFDAVGPPTVDMINYPHINSFPVSPTMSIPVTLTNDSHPAINLSCLYADSMTITLDTNAIVWIPYRVKDSIPLGSDGFKKVWARFKDNEGNVSAWRSDSLLLDQTAPTTPTIAIGPRYTQDADPAAVLDCFNADSMKLTLDTTTGIFRDTLFLDSLNLGVEGFKRVWLQTKDTAGNKSPWVFDSVTFDTTAPQNDTLRFVDNLGFTKDSMPILRISSIGADSIALSLDGATWLPFEPFDTVKVSPSIALGGDGQKTIYAKFLDFAGNVTNGSHYDSTVYDTKFPDSSYFSVSAHFTHDSDPLLSLYAVSVDSTDITLDTNVFSWRGFALTDSVNLGTEGVKRLCVRYKDLAGNITPWLFDSLVFDSTMPQTPAMTILDNIGYTNDATPTIRLSSDGADSMSFSLDGTSWTVYEKYDTIKSNFDISSGGNGIKKVYVSFKDNSDNYTDGTLFDSTFYDSQIPDSSSISIVLDHSSDPDPALIYTQ